MLHWMICMIPVFTNGTLEELIDTCHWRISKIHVFASVTLEDLYDTCVCQCYIGGFV